jgi:intein-encoded DNA endonuclease-like protein
MQQKNERSKRKSHFISKDYVKGFFDEEGCVYVKQKQIIITNTNQELLKEISVPLLKFIGRKMTKQMQNSLGQLEIATD